MDLNNLKGWCEQHNIIERTMGYFWTAFERYQKEETDEFNSVFGNFDKKIFQSTFVRFARVLIGQTFPK